MVEWLGRSSWSDLAKLVASTGKTWKNCILMLVVNKIANWRSEPWLDKREIYMYVNVRESEIFCGRWSWQQAKVGLLRHCPIVGKSKNSASLSLCMSIIIFCFSSFCIWCYPVLLLPDTMGVSVADVLFVRFGFQTASNAKWSIIRDHFSVLEIRESFIAA